MGRHIQPHGYAVCSEAARNADSGVRPELAAGGMDRGLERHTQAKGISGNDGGAGESDEMDTVATTGASARAEERR